MSAYDISSNELNKAYQVDGTELASVFDIDGVEYPFEHQIPVLFSDIPEWYQNDVVNALAYVNGLDDGYVNYIVMTDTHYGDAYPNAPKIFNYLYQEGRFDKLIHLGDMLANSGLGSANWNSLIDRDFFHFKEWLFAQGNHDTGLSVDLAEALTYFETTENIRYTISASHNMYYYDNPEYKIRFIGAHFYEYMNDKETLEAYIKAGIKRGYKWVFLSHFPFRDVSSAGLTTEDETWLKSMIEQYGNFICMLAGHHHADVFLQESTATKTFWAFTFDADISGIRETYGENSDQVISILSINPITEKIKIYRIGRSAQYEGKSWEFTGFAN